MGGIEELTISQICQRVDKLGCVKRHGVVFLAETRQFSRFLFASSLCSKRWSQIQQGKMLTHFAALVGGPQ